MQFVLDLLTLHANLAVAAGVALVAALDAAVLIWAVRRGRASARAEAALRAELAVFKDASITVARTLEQRGLDRRSGERVQPDRGTVVRGAFDRERRPAADERVLVRTGGVVIDDDDAPLTATPMMASAQMPNAQMPGAQPASADAARADTQRAFELARQGATVEDLVAACDVSRTEAGLVLAMSRRGRRFAARA